ncbi:MAG: ABC transporter permease [Ruminococcus sp.]|jgi:ABC-2 type transport system permease protein|nr:ABC transporter permease [Ruminococcus sp.]
MKFSNLFKKEITGLLTRQAIVSMIVTMFLFIMLGQIVGGAMNGLGESISGSKLSIANLDDSAFTADILARMEADGSTLNMVKLPENITPADYPAELERLDIKSLIIIPAGFGDNIVNNGERGSITVISEMNVGGMMTNIDSLSAADAVNTINAASKDEILLKTYGVSEEVLAKLDAGASTVDYTTLDGKIAKISPASLSMVMMFQMMIAPIAVFFLLTMASQMIMTAISTEKIDKTLETLLSTPVSRLSVLMSKMTAAVVAAILNAITMGIGMIFYIGGIAGGVASGIMGSTDLSSIEGQVSSADFSAVTDAVASVPQALLDLGITLSVPEYLLFGLQLILSLAIGLAAALLLGAMATDAKSQASLMLPVTIASLLPFFVTLMADVNSMPVMFRIIMYAIPFTNAYMAIPNLMSGNLLIFWVGAAYQALFLAGTLYAAVRMFMSDRLFTTNFGDMQNKKSLFAKK